MQEELFNIRTSLVYQSDCLVARLEQLIDDVLGYDRWGCDLI